MEQNTIELSDQKFLEIYSNEDFRNKVAFAHACYDKNVNFKYMATCSYPTSYIVTDDQITTAKAEYEKAKKETYAKHKTDLLFIGMGMTYESRYQDDICNHRIRTEFLNCEGKQYFVEFSEWNGNTHVDFSIDRDLQKELESKNDQGQSCYNFGSLEKQNLSMAYTKTNILNLVNRIFCCDFTNIVVDNYNTHPQDQEIICESPKSKR